MNNNSGKKKNSVFNPKNLVVVAIAATVVILFALVMNVLVPKAPEEKATQTFSGTVENEVRQTESKIPDKVEEKEVSPPPRTEKKENETPAEEKSSVPEQEERPPEKVIDTLFAMPVKGAIINDYSGEELVYSETMDDWRTHNGIDIAAQEGNDVFAVSDGTVEAVTDGGMFGKTVIILHSGGIRSIYANLSDEIQIEVGKSVLKGDIIGKVGSSASAESAQMPHLHFEMSKNEEIVNPHDFLPESEEE